MRDICNAHEMFMSNLAKTHKSDDFFVFCRTKNIVVENQKIRNMVNW